jgi:hypothetical protein
MSLRARACASTSGRGVERTFCASRPHAADAVWTIAASSARSATVWLGNQPDQVTVAPSAVCRACQWRPAIARIQLPAAPASPLPRGTAHRA